MFLIVEIALNSISMSLADLLVRWFPPDRRITAATYRYCGFKILIFSFEMDLFTRKHNQTPFFH